MRRFILIVWLALSTISAVAESVQPNKALFDLPAVLGWTLTPITSQNLCGGYYAEPASITAHPNPLPITDMPMDITSSGPADYNLTSTSTLQDNVVLLQPGRKIRADQAVLTPNKDTGKLEHIDLKGNVQFQEAGQLLAGEAAHIDLAQKTLAVEHGAYRVVRPAKTGDLNAWGTADETYRSAPGISLFKQVTYTTCKPTNTAWHIKSKQLTLNKNTGRGKAKHVTLYAKNIPFFYSPFLSFPIDKRRYSGLLYPDFGYDSESGAFIGIPYYFNLAPNYDDTFTLTPMTKRGVMTDNLFRYLTAKSNGSLQLTFLPNDRAFLSFKQLQKVLYSDSSYNTPFLDVLNSSSNNRSSISFHDSTIFSNKWSSSVDVNYVSDDYYFQDLGTNPASISTDQLLNQALIAYQGEHWQFSGRVEAWQTLHPINQTFVLDQYQRLPQLTLSSFWPDEKHGLRYTFDSEWVYFNHAHDFFTQVPYPTGNRLHISPQISLPLNGHSAFFTPSLAFDTTSYVISNNGIINTNVSPVTLLPNSDPNLNKIRALPIFNLDAGVYFGRGVTLFKHSYRQTVEPRLFYLFVPYSDQDNIPVFDTTLPPFGFDELFRTNRFMGYDRIGDSNQVSLGLTSRLLDDYTGAEKINAGIGAIYYFRKHSVCLYPDCRDDPTVDDHVSPIAAQLTYYLTPKLSMTANAAWDPNKNQMNNDAIYMRYSPDAKRIINLGYNYIKNGDVLNAAEVDSKRNNLHRIDLSISWPIATHWNAVADWNYNISHAHPQTYLYGLEYDTCCWAIRLISSRVLQAEDLGGNTAFRSAYYIQFLFKGLGSVGDTSGSTLLTSSVPGYSDIFSS
jgi:LPS-assembly protein